MEAAIESAAMVLARNENSICLLFLSLGKIFRARNRKASKIIKTKLIAKALPI